LFDFSLKVNGFNIDKAKLALLEIQNKSDEDFRDYIAAKKKSRDKFLNKL